MYVAGLVLALACDVGDDGSSTAGVGGQTGSGGAIGESGGAPSCDGSKLPPLPNGCTPDCATEPEDQEPIVCQDGEWQCPEGRFLASECELKTCARRYENRCCDRATGNFVTPECGPSGKLEACAPGSEEWPANRDCVAADLDVSDCTELQNLACQIEGQACQPAFRCSTGCWCAKSSAGGLRWSCSSLPC